MSQRKRIPRTKPSTSAIASQSPAPSPYLVRLENMTVGTWLRQIAAYRPQLSVEDRLETLLWSWPIRPAITPLHPNPLWSCKGDDEETLEHKAAVQALLDNLERGWYPYESPSKIQIHHVDFNNKCRDICDQLRELPGVTVPDPDDDPLWLATLFEASRGDGQRDYRRDLQEKVVARLNERSQQYVCQIGERARDAAYLSVRTTRLLDAVRHTKASVKSFLDWLREAGNYQEFVEGQITCIEPTVDSPEEIVYYEDRAAFSAAFRVIMARRKRVTDYVHDAFDSLRKDEGRDKRTQAGRPGRGAWVKPANDDLTRLKIPTHTPRDRTLRLQERRDLLIAWGLVPLERD